MRLGVKIRLPAYLEWCHSPMPFNSKLHCNSTSQWPLKWRSNNLYYVHDSSFSNLFSFQLSFRLSTSDFMTSFHGYPMESSLNFENEWFFFSSFLLFYCLEIMYVLDWIGVKSFDSICNTVEYTMKRDMFLLKTLQLNDVMILYFRIIFIYTINIYFWSTKSFHAYAEKLNMYTYHHLCHFIWERPLNILIDTVQGKFLAGI